MNVSCSLVIITNPDWLHAPRPIPKFRGSFSHQTRYSPFSLIALAPRKTLAKMAQHQREKSEAIVGPTGRRLVRGKNPSLTGATGSYQAGRGRRGGEGEQAGPAAAIDKHKGRSGHVPAAVDTQKGRSGHGTADDDKLNPRQIQLVIELLRDNPQLWPEVQQKPFARLLRLINEGNDDCKEESDDDQSYRSPRSCPPQQHRRINWQYFSDE